LRLAACERWQGSVLGGRDASSHCAVSGGDLDRGIPFLHAQAACIPSGCLARSSSVRIRLRLSPFVRIQGVGDCRHFTSLLLNTIVEGRMDKLPAETSPIPEPARHRHVIAGASLLTREIRGAVCWRNECRELVGWLG
jgi:hypothetical protein